jgi:hypothetical protein
MRSEPRKGSRRSETKTTLALSRPMLARLSGHLLTFLYEAWFQELRTPEEEQRVRIISALMQRILRRCEKGVLPVRVPLTTEEVQVLRALFLLLRQFYHEENPDEFREMALTDLAACQHLLEEVTDQSDEDLSRQDGQT